MIVAPWLCDLNKLFIVEEATSMLRHDVRNKLSAIRNANFFLRRKVETDEDCAVNQDPRVGRFFDVIESQLTEVASMLNPHLRVLDTSALRPAIDVADSVRRVIDATPAPDHVVVEGPSTSEPLLARADQMEFELALACVLENAIDAVAGQGGKVTVECSVEHDGRVITKVCDSGGGLAPGLSVDDTLRPFFTTKADRVGLGLNIARRIAGRWRGTLEIAPRNGGICVAIALSSPQKS
ncbi:MAG TPA: ATP-binding protein [Thermoanaerobaculia bacterium]|nr:ATP-binding protein [Thermoanaerobaculia bacterium]